MFGRIKRIHFIGLGGIGISGMAELLHTLGFQISGSDLRASEITANLQRLGIKFHEGHAAENIADCDMVVYSSAVRQDNSEIIAAKARNIPVIRRAEMLGELLSVAETSVAVGGTHGKTTTSSMVGTLLTHARRDPTMVIGGIVKSLATNARHGSGDIIVVEADEFDRTFLSLRPSIAVITNIALEHLDCYENLEDLSRAFTQFANAVPFYGHVIACHDDPNVQAILKDLHRPVITYGFAPQADVQARKLVQSQGNSEYEVHVANHDPMTVKLNAPGAHNVLNSLAAIAVGLELEVPIHEIVEGLAQYSGVNRRFEIFETVNDVMFVDDYAHHPHEVAATLEAAREGWDRRIVSVFQPHLYSRTRDFHEDFSRAFLDSDVLIVTDVYPARELPIEGISGRIIADGAVSMGHKHVVYIEDKNNLPEEVSGILKPGDLVLTLGAGDITHFNQKIREAFSK